jgi:hypothetical protein
MATRALRRRTRVAIEQTRGIVEVLATVSLNN